MPSLTQRLNEIEALALESIQGLAPDAENWQHPDRETFGHLNSIVKSVYAIRSDRTVQQSKMLRIEAPPQEIIQAEQNRDERPTDADGVEAALVAADGEDIPF